MSLRRTWCMLVLAKICLGICASPGQAAPLRIGFVEAVPPAARGRHGAAALTFAQSVGQVTILRAESGAWRDPLGTPHAPDEFDVVWYHQGDDPNLALLDTFARDDLAGYLRAGGALLLTGAAGRLLNDLDIEPTSLRVLPVSGDAYPSGLVVRPEHRGHPLFEGLVASQPVLLTSFGGAALADFYGTAGPTGVLLADGNAGLGEHPVVEYRRSGTVLFVGWRLPDFTTDHDPHRPHLERLFTNALHYLAQANRARVVMARPAGEARYRRVLGVPFLTGDSPTSLAVPHLPSAQEAVALLDRPAAGAVSVGRNWVIERPIGEAADLGPALALTVTARATPVAAVLDAEKADERRRREEEERLTRGLRIVRPTVRTRHGPLKPSREARNLRPVLLGRSPFMAPGDGLADITPVYEPIEEGGFRIVNSTRRLNRPIVQGQNRVWTGDVPLFRMDTTTGNGCYSADKVFALWPRPDAQSGATYPCMGTLRVGIVQSDGGVDWLDAASGTVATFRPGWSRHEVPGEPGQRPRCIVTIAPTEGGHGMVCRVEAEAPVRVAWRFGGLYWSAGERNANRVELRDGLALLSEPNLPNGLVAVGSPASCAWRVVPGQHGQEAFATSVEATREHLLAATWGVVRHDDRLARELESRLDTANAALWPVARDRLKRRWRAAYVEDALFPEERLRQVLRDPAGALRASIERWERRTHEFRLDTPDDHLDALVNWQRSISEYHRQGPGLVLGAQFWVMYSHISTGWYGKQWAGDHEAVEDCLRLYAAMQRDDGYIRWVSPSLTAFYAENNTPYWVDQVWRHYTWTGDRQFLVDMWPSVRSGVDWLRRTNDPDGDGLYRDAYEYWNCDSNGKGPKAAAASAMAWAALDRAARIAEVVGDAVRARELRSRAERSLRAIQRELWRPREGRLGSIGADGQWRGHGQTWEQYLAILAGALTPQQGLSAMRWIEASYGFEPNPGVKLLTVSDWWPLRWSVQWVPTGDTCLAALAGMVGGDPDLWYPYVRTAVHSAFRSDFPGINMGISNAGAGGGDREDVDSVDPYLYMAVRGLFGVEPALDRGELSICPAFPRGWTRASLRTPDLEVTYRRDGDRATFTVRTPQPLVKRVRASFGGPEVVTPKETVSTVVVRLGRPPAAPARRPPAPLLAERQPPSPAEKGPGVRSEEARRQVLFDLSPACNVTSEGFTSTGFIYDYDGQAGVGGVWTGNPQPIAGWWGNPALSLPVTPRVIDAPNGVRFLTVGRPRSTDAEPPRNVLALSSWPPQPFPASAQINVGMRLERLWLLLQSYVHPMKNYIVNGEIVLRYEGGRTTTVPLIPPYNLDAYFQHFSRAGVPISMGRLGPSGFIASPLQPHADALHIACDPKRTLRSIEIRATCSEGAIGLLAMTGLEPP